MKLESDRMHNLQMAEKEFDKEIKVVMEERRWRTDDDPHSLMYEKLMATAFQEHPYHNPVIGWMNDMQNMTAADARDWYKTWYAPNNATLVIAGDVKANEVFALAQTLLRQHSRSETAATQSGGRSAATRHQAHRGQSSGGIALSDDGLSRADPARCRERLEALRAGSAGWRAGRQRVRHA